MDLAKEANQLVQDCELRIRAMMESALAERRYDEIAKLASLASGLAGLVDGGPNSSQTTPPLGTAFVETAAVADSVLSDGDVANARSSAGLRRRQANEYPRFERHADRLIKLGWSKKDRSIYEHRVPFAAIRPIIEKLVSSFGKGGFLRMEAVLPIVLEDRTEVPSYQAYLVLAWLRELGVVQRHGNDGYKLLRKRLNENDVEEFLKQTPERE